MPSQDNIPQYRPTKLKLPFMQRADDPGEWAFDHRVGLCITVIAYLVAGIVFMSSRIAIGQKQTTEAFYVDLIDDRSTPEERQRQLVVGEELTDVRNLQSNENAGESDDQELNSRIMDDRGTDAQRIYAEAADAQARMSENRAAYEAGLRQVEEIGRSSSDPKRDNTVRSGDRKVQGKVTVSFSLINPIRTSSYLHVPAYQCEGGGELVVEVIVNRNGEVLSASTIEASASVDDCMVRTAEGAARRSRFNIDSLAPERHRGTITYIFIPQ